LTTFWVSRNLWLARTADNTMNAMMITPCTCTLAAPIVDGKT
jgi:hypothetical protein